MATKYNSDGFPVFVPDPSPSSASPGKLPFDYHLYPTFDEVVGAPEALYKMMGTGSALLGDVIAGGPARAPIRPGSDILTDIIGESTPYTPIPDQAFSGLYNAALSVSPDAADLIGERQDATKPWGLAEQSPEERHAWQATHPVAAYTKAIGEPVGKLVLQLATDPVMAGMTGMSVAAKAGRFLKVAEEASKVGKTVEAAAAAGEAAKALRASKTMQAIASGQSEVGSYLLAHPKVTAGAERLLGASFVPGMATGAIEGVRQTARQFQESGLSPDVVRSGAEAGMSGVFAGLGLKHALTPQVAGPRMTGLSPERLDTALRGADLAQDVVRARAATEVAPRVENAPIVAEPAPIVEAPPARVESPEVVAPEVARPAAPVAPEAPPPRPLDVALLRDDIGEYGERTYDPELIRRFEAGREGFSDAEVASYAPEGATPQDIAAIRLDHSLKFEALRRGKEWLDTLNERHPGEGTSVETVPIGSGGLAGHDVLQRVNGKIVGAGEGFAGYRQQMAGGKVYSSPASMRPVYETMDSLGYLPSDVLSPFGRKAQRKYAKRQGSAGPVLPDAVVDSSRLAPGGGRPEYPAGVQDVVGGEPGERGQAVPQVGAVPAEAPRIEPIIAQTRREAYQALHSKYGDTPPDVKTMVDQHGVKIEWANDIRKRWGTPAWEGGATTTPLRAETDPLQQAPEHAAVVKDLAYQLTQNPPMGFEATAREEGGKHYVDLVKDGMHARVDVASGTVEAATGGAAMGEMRVNPSIPNEAVLTIAKTAATPNTINHEMAEWMARLLPEAEQVQLARQYGMRGWEDRFARAYEKWKPSVKNAIFSKIYDLARPLADSILSEKQKSEAIMGLMSEGKLVQRMGGAAFTNPQARVEIARELEAQPEPTKKQVAMALARDLGVEDIVRHEAGADAFLFDATSLLRGSVRDVTRINPIGTAFLRDVVDPKTNYGTYAPALEKAKAMFGDDLQKKYEEWVNTRQLPSVGAAFERIRGDVKTRRTIGVGIEHAVRADLESIVPDLKQTLGISGVGEQVGAGAFANVFDLGPDAEGVRRVARVSALPGDNARPRMVSEFIAPEIGRQFTADKREVTIQPYTYSKEEVGKNQQRFNEDVARLTRGLEAQGFKDLDIHDSNVRYLDKEGTKPVVVDLGSVQPKDSKVPAAEWIANKVDEYADFPPGGLDPATYVHSGGPGVGRSLSDIDPESIRGKFGTFTERLRFMFADKLSYMKKAEAATYKMHGKGAEVPASESAASALEVFPSRAMDRIKKVVEVAMDEVDALISKNNSTMDDIGAVLVAEHAPVRNRVGREQGTKVENAMGVSDADAAKVKADMIADGAWERAMPAANRFRKLMQDQVDLMEEYHLAPPERLAALRSPEWRDTYAPAKHEDPLSPWEPSSGGGGVRNPLKRFAGRATPPDNPLGFGFSQAAETIAKGEHNLAWNKFAEFIRQNPDENWRVLDEPKMHGSKVEIGGKLQVASVPDKGWMDKHTIAFRDSAGAEKFLQINDPRVMESLKRSGPDTTGEVLGYVAKGVRFYSGLLTRWNPEFLFPNFQRDLQMALASIGVEKGVRVVKQVTKGVIPAMRATWKVLRNPEASGEWEDSYKEYSAAGGPMNVLQLKNGPQYLKEAGKRLERLTKPNQFKEVFRKSIQVLDDLNGAVETGVRLSYFKALREAGMSVEGATLASKNLTVNFDRRGALGPAMNSLYLFFNASVQGGMRTAQVLNSPRGRKAALAMMVGGYALDQAQAASGEDSNGDGISDWDSIPEYVKERNLIIGNATIPMPYGFNTIVNAGRLASAVMRGQMSPARAASNGALSFFSTFNPFGGAEDFTQMVTPSFLEPFVQSATNKNFAGNAIVPDQPKWGAKKPDSERFWRTTSPVAKWLAQTGNTLTGGDKLSAGFVDISPNTIEHWSNFALGGWSRILSGSQAVAESVAKGEPIPISKIPIVRRQYYEEHPADVGRMWRQTQEEMEQLKARAEMYQKDRQFDRLRKIPRPLLGMADYLARVEREAQDIQKAVRAGSISEKAGQERVKQLQIRSLLNVTKARQRAESMGFNGGYAASPGSGI